MGIFSIDGAFSRIGTKVFDILVLTFYWMFCSILTLGIGYGAATTAFFYAMDKTIIHESGYITKNYFKSFKLNFKNATIIWIIICLIYFICFANIRILNSIDFTYSFIIRALQFTVLLEVTFLHLYVFALLAKLELTIKGAIVQSLLLAHKHLPITILSLIIAALFTYLTLQFNFLLIFLGIGVFIYIHSKLVLNYVLGKYLPKEDLSYSKSNNN